MTGKEAIKTLMDGETIACGEDQLRLAGTKVQINSVNGWSKWPGQLEDIFQYDWELVKPKPEKPKYFQCWAQSRLFPERFYPVMCVGKDEYRVKDIESNEKGLFKHWYIYDRDGNLIQE